MQTNQELVYLIYLLTNASLHRSLQEQIELHRLLGFCPPRWFCTVSNKSKLMSKGWVRRSMFSPQYMSKSLGLSSAPLSASRKPPGLDRNNDSHIQPLEKAEGKAVQKSGCICHPSILFNPLPTPSLPVVPLTASRAQRSRKSHRGLAQKAAGSQSSGGEESHGFSARHQAAPVERRAEPNLDLFQGNF